MTKFLTRFVLLFTLLASLVAGAQESSPVVESFKGEAEAGAVVVSGNTDSESYAGKGTLSYISGLNTFTIFGKYLETKANSVESAKNWNAGIRYDRAISDYFSVYVGYKGESDKFAGYLQRDSADAGIKYYIVKSDQETWITELGYRYSEILSTASTVSYESFGRLYTEYSRSLDKTLSFKYWVEYLPNFTNNEAYLLNTEASLNVMINQIFSLKLAYLLQYQNVPPATGDRTDKTFTTTLVAKF